MANRKSSYFIAIIPPEEISSKVVVLKRYFAEKFEAPKGLNILPHITLQMPFYADPVRERLLIDSLESFAPSNSSFDIKLNGFGFFKARHSHVVYIQVEENPFIIDLHSHLMTFLRSEAAFNIPDALIHFKPHMTIAYRDLSKEQFNKAWPEFEQARFEETWTCNSLHLLKHNGKQWQSLAEFRLKRTHL